MFDTILEKLGFKDSSVKAAPAKAGSAEAAPPPAQPTLRAAASAAAAPAADPGPAARQVSKTVDVMGKLERLAAANSRKLNWRTSIVDLLKLLDVDSSFSARKALAVELGCPPDKMGDSAHMNIWLHAEVLRKLAANGGNVPSELLN